MSKEVPVPAILIPSLGRPEKLAKTVSQLKEFRGHILVGLARDEVNTYRDCPNSLTDISWMILKNQKKGGGPARRELYNAAVYFYPEIDSLLFMDDDVTIKQGTVDYLFESMQLIQVGVVSRRDEAFWNFCKPIPGYDYLREMGRPTQLWGMRRDVYDEVGGFSDMPRGEDIDLQLRVRMTGRYVVGDGRVRARGEYFQVQGGMFEVEGRETGAETPAEAARIKDADQVAELNRKYDGIVSSFVPATGKWRLSHKKVRELTEKYGRSEIRFDADTGILHMRQVELQEC